LLLFRIHLEDLQSRQGLFGQPQLGEAQHLSRIDAHGAPDDVVAVTVFRR